MSTSPPQALPLIDEHETLIGHPAGQVWAALVAVVDEAFTRPAWRPYARAVGCADLNPSGPRPLQVGSTVTGFRVTAADAGSVLELVGRHRFSIYALRFELEQPVGSSTRLRAISRAEFPGAAGAVYRCLVIRTRIHVVLVRRLLATVARRSPLHRASGPSAPPRP